MLKVLKILQIIKGGAGSGNWGHVGRKGHKGGSQSNKNVMSINLTPAAKKRFKQTKSTKTNKPKSKTPTVASKNSKVGQAIDPKSITDIDRSNSVKVSNDIIFGVVDHNVASMSSHNLKFSYKNVNDNSTRGIIKNNLVNNLAKRTGMPVEKINEIIAEWAATSNDNNMRVLSMQESASVLFGTKLSNWQKGKIDQLEQYGDKYELDTHFGSLSEDGTSYVLEPGIKKLGYKTVVDAEKAILKAMYDETQAAFREQGITEVVVHRGIVINDSSAKSYTRNAPTTIKDSNALESWTLDEAVTNTFASPSLSVSFKLSMKVPVERILSTAGTGLGCASEYEVVVIGGKDDQVFVND